VKEEWPPTTVQEYAHSKLLKESVKPECVDFTITASIKSVKPEHIDSMIPLTTSIEEVPDEEEPALAPIPDETSKTFDTKDIWDNFEPSISDVSTYLLHDNDVLIEYQTNGSEMCIINNMSFDTPLT
jgi:hypothetical protein